MIVLVTGSRTWHDSPFVWEVLDGLLVAAEQQGQGLALHHGLCPRGVDSFADAWGFARQADGRPVLVVRHPARWTDDLGRFDRRAGFRRNADMVAVVRALPGVKEVHAFIRKNSTGATHCANRAAEAGLKVIRHRWEER